MRARALSLYGSCSAAFLFGESLIQVDERFVERIAVDNLTMDMVDLLKHGKAPIWLNHARNG